ncbi:RhoGAP-domain-containing protein [Zalerion maritima]|uniref:RhoGAP-domain-containing protein n=1 Tax=Zalerion maritima TaxID=339359 RepID=A0AAD5WWK2_9PEZI|nr:RhoGAP-domain-containing protein [Zalerion maritima]
MSQTMPGLSDAEKHPPSPIHSLHNSVSSTSSSSLHQYQQQYDRPLQDSPTIGRVHIHADTSSDPHSSSSSPSPPTNPVTLTVGRHLRKPIPSPLHTTTAVSPPSSASPTKSDFSSIAHDQRDPSRHHHYGQHAPLTPVFPTSTSGQTQEKPRSSSSQNLFSSAGQNAPTVPEQTVLDLDFDDSLTTDSSPEQHHLQPKKAFGPRLSSLLLPLQPSTNAIRYSPEPAIANKPLAGSPNIPMAGPPAVVKMEGKGAPRNSSIDSAISAISSRTHSHKDSQDSIAGSQDVTHLIKTAGSPEAVIQYLLREKQSQNTQNTQLWRLVDKQRAMILGLNKDLERALKDKEKYRKKLKEVMSAQDTPRLSNHFASAREGLPTIARVDVDAPKGSAAAVPDSPNPDIDSAKASPIDVSMAPYPITPPADQVSGPPSAVGELLDPSHSMPKPAEHAYDKYDAEEEERKASRVEDEKKQAMNKDLPFNVGLPPSRSLPSEPPRMPPPNPPTGPPETSPKTDGISQFPPPPAPPPRKPPPAPLQLDKSKQEPEEEDSDSDFDSLLEVTEIDQDKRGRRRTREEDDKERAILALKEAEARSLSKKSKGSQKGTPIVQDLPASPRSIAQPVHAETVTASLAGILSGGDIRTQTLNAPAAGASHGLPASPRPMGGVGSPMHSPPLSPRGMNAFTGPLSPRPPRAPIPLPPNTPLSTPSPVKDASNFTSPQPLNITTDMIMPTIVAPPSSPPSRDSPSERRRIIFKGLVTDEYPDLLLPPNALPSVDVRVASSRMKPSRASMLSLTQLEEDPVFTLAISSRADRGELWRVEKDSVSLAKLDQRLKQCPAFTTKSVDRSLFSGHSPAKLDARRTALDAYLAELLDSPLDTATALEFCRYLSTNTLPPNSDETLPPEPGRETIQKIGPGGRALRSGYLTKRGKNFGGWKARFFVLDGPQLKYFDGLGGPHLGTIKLLSAQIGKQSNPSEGNGSPARPGDDENQYRHAFLILEPKKKDSSSHVKHVLCAESDKERDQWVDALLQWTDYRDPEEEERAHKGSNSHDHDKPVAKKKRTDKGRQMSDSSDALIAMSYDTTKQGDLPTREGAAARPKTANGPDTFSETMHSQAYNISAPRDPQVISDAGMWGSKTGGLQAPTMEEKKARKRSFFGFGPKTRSSSDVQDPLFDNSPSGGAAAPESRGPPRQVFGAPLADAVRYNGPVDVKVPLPAVVYRCIQYLDAKGALGEEGIFRLSGSSVVIKGLKDRFNTEGDINLLNDEAYHDIHAVASLLKLYLRELPTTILTRDLHMQFLSITEMRDHREKIAALSELVERLPQANGTLLKYLIAFLIKIINNADRNKMTVRNVGIVFSPTLNIPNPVFAMLLQNYEGIFGIDPEQYELPSPVSDNDSHSQSRPSFDRNPQRPSTASNSPSRQRLMEAMAERQRGESRTGSTPTPPPVVNIAASRSSPTPPPMRGYEPAYLAQQQTQSGANARPAYEGGLSAPPASSYDASQHQNAPPPQSARSTNAGYDRPVYEQNYAGGLNPSYNQGYGTPSSNRRESVMFMGSMMGLNPQGSKSRLREETRF